MFNPKERIPDLPEYTQLSLPDNNVLEFNNNWHAVKRGTLNNNAVIIKETNYLKKEIYVLTRIQEIEKKNNLRITPRLIGVIKRNNFNTPKFLLKFPKFLKDQVFKNQILILEEKKTSPSSSFTWNHEIILNLFIKLGYLFKNNINYPDIKPNNIVYDVDDTPLYIDFDQEEQSRTPGFSVYNGIINDVNEAFVLTNDKRNKSNVRALSRTILALKFKNEIFNTYRGIMEHDKFLLESLFQEKTKDGFLKTYKKFKDELGIATLSEVDKFLIQSSNQFSTKQYTIKKAIDYLKAL